MTDIFVDVDRRGPIVALALNRPPVNALGAPLRRMLSDHLAALIGDPGVSAIILRAEGPMFSAGADIREFGQSPVPPGLSVLCSQIEASPKPVVAALHGKSLGGGTEIALAAHYRLALPGATLALPEVTLGLIPGAGGTQRLPRLVGAQAAIDMMLEGRAVTAEAADAMGLIDGVVHGDLVAAAFAFAQGLVSQGLGPRPTRARRDRMRDGTGWLAAVEKARAAHRGRGMLAEDRIIDCVEAALLLPFDAALAYERTAFADCLTDPKSRAMRRLFLAERRAAGDILARDGQGHLSLTRDAVALAMRLALAQQAAAEALVRGPGGAAPLDPAFVDRALVDQGFGAGPFGGMEGGAGPAGPAIARRINAAVLAEGCRMIADGVVRDAGMVDVLAVFGVGYPRDTGGPMQVAMADGLMALRADMARWAADDPLWAVPPLLVQATRYAGGFDAVPAIRPG